MADSLPFIVAVLISGAVLIELYLDKKWEAFATSLSGASVVIGLYGVTR